MNNLALQFASNGDESNALLERHASLVARIAHHLKGRLPDTVEVDDLIQAGMIGLLEASQNYVSGAGAGFETFAGIRIRGAMLDEVRRNDWVPRSVYRKSRELSQAIQAVEARTGREAKAADVAAEMDIELSEYYRLLKDVGSTRILSVEEMGFENESALERFASEDSEACEGVMKIQLRDQLAKEIAALPEREGLILSLYYDDELNLREIGEILSVSESRVCQLHSQAVARLRARMSASA